MSNRWRVAIAGVVALAFIVWAAIVLTRRWEQLPAINFHPWSVTAVVFLAWTVVVVNSLIVEFGARLVGRGLGLRDSQMIGFIVTLLNYVAPLRAGLAVRLGYYVRVCGQDPITLSAVLVASTAIIQAIAIAVFVLMLLRAGRTDNGVLLLALVASVLVATAWIVRNRRFENASGTRWANILNRISLGFRALVGSGSRAILVIAGYALIPLVATGARYGVEATLFGPGIDPGVALAMAAASGVSSLLAVTFGGLGVREAAVVIVGRLFELSPELCLMLVLTDRVLVTGALVLSGVPALVLSRKWLMGPRDVGK